jgi:hypothetical protein
MAPYPQFRQFSLLTILPAIATAAESTAEAELSLANFSVALGLKLPDFLSH